MISADIPALTPPNGVHSNFTHPKTLRTSLIAVNTTFLLLMVPVVIIRIYSRGYLTHALCWDDCAPNIHNCITAC